MPFGWSKIIRYFLVHKWQEISKTIIQYLDDFFDFGHSMDKKYKKMPKSQNADKNRLGEYLAINLRHPILI